MGADWSERHIRLVSHPLVYSSYEDISHCNDKSTSKPLPSPFTLLVLNKLIKLLYIECLGQKGSAKAEWKRKKLIYSARFLEIWKDVPFLGNRSLRQKIFGAVTPLPFSILLQGKYLHDLRPFLGNLGPENDQVREWIHQGIISINIDYSKK